MHMERFDHYFMNLSLYNIDIIRNGKFTQIQISVAGNKYQNIITGPQYKTSKPLLYPRLPPCPALRQLPLRSRAATSLLGSLHVPPVSHGPP